MSLEIDDDFVAISSSSYNGNGNNSNNVELIAGKVVHQDDDENSSPSQRK